MPLNTRPHQPVRKRLNCVLFYCVLKYFFLEMGRREGKREEKDKEKVDEKRGERERERETEVKVQHKHRASVWDRMG